MKNNQTGTQKLYLLGNTMSNWMVLLCAAPTLYAAIYFTSELLIWITAMLAYELCLQYFSRDIPTNIIGLRLCIWLMSTLSYTFIPLHVGTVTPLSVLSQTLILGQVYTAGLVNNIIFGHIVASKAAFDIDKVAQTTSID